MRLEPIRMGVEGTTASTPGAGVSSFPWKTLSLALWIGVFSLLTAGYFLAPHRAVTGVYHSASIDWWAGKDLYQGLRIFNYTPQFAILFTPFHAMGPFIGDLAWRWVSLGLLAGAWWRLARLLNHQKGWKIFFWSSLLSLAACGDAIRSGQANVLLAALLLWSTYFLIERKWWRAAVSLVLGLAKPLGIVMVALAPVGYPALILPLAAVLGLFAALPFAFHPPGYVLGQFGRFADQLVQCSTVTTSLQGITDHRFADINGLFRSLSLASEIPVDWSQGIRMTAGVLVLAVWWWRSRRLDTPMREMFLLTLVTTYLMLFNPMNEVNSYVILAPACGLFAAYVNELPEGRRVAYVLYAVVGTIGILPELVRRLTYHLALWWDPLMAMVFLAVVLWFTGKIQEQRFRKPVISSTQSQEEATGTIG